MAGREKIHAVHRLNYRRYLSLMFRFGISRGYCHRNPAVSIERVQAQWKPPGVLSPNEVQILLSEAQNDGAGLMVPYFALGCFAGLRPQELRRLKWEAINFETTEIYVAPDVSKTHADRYVTMPPRLIAWLSLTTISSRCGILVYDRCAFDRIRRRAGVLDKWKSCKDIMRHSAASHFYKRTRSADLTTATMGHGLHVFMRHYKQAVGGAEAEAYFNVYPTGSDSNVRPVIITDH